MTWLPPVVIFDLDDTLINYTGMAEEVWRVICDESGPGLGLDGTQLHAALMTARVAFWSDPELNRQGRQDLVEAGRVIVGRAFATLGAGDDAQAAALASTTSVAMRRSTCSRTRSRPSKRFGRAGIGWR